MYSICINRWRGERRHSWRRRRWLPTPIANVFYMYQQVAGRAPAFVAPTPLAANSFDDNGVLVRNRTDVAVCEGYPLALDLWASDGNAGDKVRHSFRAFASLCTL